MYVTKADGTKQELQMDKIHGHCSWACEGLDGVYQSELELDSHIQFYDGIPTKDIQKLLIITAAGKTEQHYNWTFVASRLLLQSLCKEVTGGGITYPTLKSYLDKAVGKYLDSRLLTDFDLDALDKAIAPERDYQFDYLGLQTVANSYLVRDLEGDGALLELPQHFLMRVAMGLALAERPEDRTRFALAFYEIMSKLEYMPSTPTLFNSGSLRPQLSSCFIMSMGDDTDLIFDSLHETASYSKFSGGTAMDFGHIRAQGSLISSTKGKAGGVIPYIKLFDDVLNGFDQGGKRKGAGAAYLPDWHSDIHDFMRVRNPNTAVDRQVQLATMAFWVSDLFMERVTFDEDWSLFSPHDVPELNELYGDAFKEAYIRAEREGKARDKVKARELWRKMITAKFEFGVYYICFKDTINNRNMQRGSGMVRSSNLCTEITLNTAPNSYSAVCNLGSINMVKVALSRLQFIVPLAVRALNNVIDIGLIPHARGKQFNDKEKAVGLGAMGYADRLVMEGIDYESQEHLEFANDYFRELSYWAIYTSAMIARERGSYEYFDRSEWAKGRLPYDDAPAAQRALVSGDTTYGDREAELRELVKGGMRNSNVMAIAPTATIANICGVSSCTEPATDLITVKRNLHGTFTVRATAEQYGRPDLVKTARYVNQDWIVKGTAVRQIWIDQAQSMNLYIPPGMQYRDGTKCNGRMIAGWHELAHRLGAKTTYYLVSVSAKSQEVQRSQPEEEKVEEPVAAEPGQPAEGDILEGVKMCSIDNPNCESCQ